MTKYDVTRAVNEKNGKTECSMGLSETALLSWLAETMAKPHLKWFIVYESKFNAELSTPKAWRKA